jgi:hypothetical protein
MTGNRRSDRAMPELPDNRAGNACVAKDNGVPAQRTKGQIRTWLPVRAPGCRGDWLPIVAQSVPMARPRGVGVNSMPIAQTAAGAV